MTLTADEILTAVNQLDAAEREALLGELARRFARPDQAAFDAACSELAKQREARMDADPSRRRTLEQVLEAVQPKASK